MIQRHQSVMDQLILERKALADEPRTDVTPPAVLAAEKALTSNSFFLMRMREAALLAAMQEDPTDPSLMRWDKLRRVLGDRATALEAAAEDKRKERERRENNRRRREADKAERESVLYDASIAKRECLARQSAQRAQDQIEQQERDEADKYVANLKQIHGLCGAYTLPGFEAAFRAGLEGYFSARPSISQCWLTTNLCIRLANLPDAPVKEQFDFFRSLTIDKFMGCTMVAFDVWHFSRPQPIQKQTPPAATTTTLPSIFDK